MSRRVRRAALLAVAAVILLGACGGGEGDGGDAGGDVTSTVTSTVMSTVTSTVPSEPEVSGADEESRGETTVEGSRVAATVVATTVEPPATATGDEFELPPISAEEVEAIELALDELDQLLTDIELDLQQD